MADLSEIQAAMAVKVAGADPTTGVETAYLAVDTQGRPTVNSVQIDSYKATYSASVISTAMASTATDFFTISGSSTKTIRILSTAVAFVGGGSIVSAQLVKRSTADSGGTSTTAAAVPHDSLSATGTAIVRAYTANPTTGTLVGAIRAAKTDSPLASSATVPQWIEFFFGNRPGQAVVLRGANEILAWNFNGATLGAGGVFSAYIEWTEE